jgi:hypothetical protein
MSRAKGRRHVGRIGSVLTKTIGHPGGRMLAERSFQGTAASEWKIVSGAIPKGTRLVIREPPPHREVAYRRRATVLHQGSPFRRGRNHQRRQIWTEPMMPPLQRAVALALGLAGPAPGVLRALVLTVFDGK